MDKNIARPIPLIHRKMIPQLSMELRKGNLPFALTDEEKLFTPDDWAWQFLRLNQHYVKDYAKARALGLLRNKNDRRLCDADGGLDSPYKGRPGVTYRNVIEHEKHCRTRYGLSTWLNPDNKCLPSLDRECSWFFPLGLVTFGNRILLQSVIKGVFRYYDGSHTQAASEHSSAVRFTVKIDRPVSAQLRTIEYLAKRHRQVLKENQRLIVRPEEAIVDFLTRRPIKLTRPAHPGCRTVEVEIDTCGPLQKQLEHFRRALPSFMDQLPTKSKLAERFGLPVKAKKQYQTSRDNPAVVLSDGNTYKRMIILRQLSEMGLTLTEIVELVRGYAGVTRPSEDPELNYYEQFHERVQLDRGDAKIFVNKAYRWFVYAEYPLVQDKRADGP